MAVNRREWSLGMLAALTAASPPAGAVVRRPLRLLVLGGTQFIGVHLVREAQRRGHTITLFNRGRTRADIFPEVEKLRGDRDGQIDALRGREWDAVIDDSGYVPRHVQLTCDLLAPSVPQYLFISSISAYASFGRPNDEGSPLAPLRVSGTEQINGDTYGPFKALSEDIVRKAYPDRSMVLRPGFVVGPEDPTGRFCYWLAHLARGGQMPVPGDPGVPMQFIDARDLVRFALDLIEARRSGTWNVVTPAGRFTMGDLVASAVSSARRRAHPPQTPRPVWIPREFIVQQGIDPKQSFPLWPGDPEEPALAQVSGRAALSAGLKITPIARTVDDTMAWLVATPQARTQALAGGLGESEQGKLLQAWRGRSAHRNG
jgi:2'-hydroxyisoflavone reductase